MPEESVLASVPLFCELDAESLQSLEAFAFRRTFKPGELIVEEGRTGNGLYVILSGNVDVCQNMADGSSKVLRKMGQGEPFGELALLGEWPRTASVRAIDQVECLGIDRWIFLSYLERHPKLAIRMLQILAHRLADTPNLLEE